MRGRHLLFVFLSTTATARVINIPAEYPTIQQGINASVNGDTVLVQNGVYVENVNFFDKGIFLLSTYVYTRDTLDIHNTIIDGDSANSVITIMPGDVAGSVEGFTLRNGAAGNHGSGVYCEGRHAVIRNNIITMNRRRRVMSNGGGIACLDSANCVIANNRITHNFAEEGGGIYVIRSRPIILNNLISDNEGHWSGETGWGGGGIYCESPAVIIGNVFSHNNAFMGGGAIKSFADLVLVNNVFYGNWAGTGSGGGAMAFHNVEDPSLLINNILWGNEPNQITNYSSNLSVIYCDIQGGYSGTGNINVDPLFRDTAAGDFHLQSVACGNPFDSPCIDTGHPDSLDAELSCVTGLGTTRSDMGAFGGGGNLTGIGNQDALNNPSILTLGNFPNPFNSSTIIAFSVPQDCQVTINIFDLLGRKVETLMDSRVMAGYHTAKWKSGAISSGVYFYQIRAGSSIASKAMTLIR
jgi:hypothetical protein